MGDPLYANGIDAAVVLITLLKVVLTFVFLLLAVLLYIWRSASSSPTYRTGSGRTGRARGASSNRWRTA